MQVVSLDQIKSVLPDLDLIHAIEEGFVAYSARQAVVPPVGELLLEQGEVHIKYGFLRNQPYYVIKIASGFYQNPSIGLPSSNGLMLLFRQDTGQLACILLDEGLLTDTRTAVAGAIAARHLAPASVERIGMIGTGIQARLQLIHLQQVVPTRDVMVWGRDAQRTQQYCEEMNSQGFQVTPAKDVSELAGACRLIVTTTPAREPLLLGRDVQPGTHVTAVGSDTPEKQELDRQVFAKAGVVVADSIVQCTERGEIRSALAAGAIDAIRLVELGDVIAARASGRTCDEQITVADLTGVAVQDIQIASAVYSALNHRA